MRVQALFRQPILWMMAIGSLAPGLAWAESPRHLSAELPADAPLLPSPRARIVNVVEKGSAPRGGGANPTHQPPRLRRPVVDQQIQLVSLHESEVASLPASEPESFPAPPPVAETTDAGRPRGVWVNRRKGARADRVPALMVQDSTSPGESLDKPAESSFEAIAPSAATPTVTTGDVLPPERVATAPEASLAVATDERALSTVPSRVEPAPTFDDAVKPATHRKPVLNALVIPEPSAGVPTKAQHIIQIGDELDVAFPYQPIVGDATMQRLQPPLFRTERVVVREDGMIVLPLIEPVLAAGLTPEDVRAELVDRYLPFQYDPLANRKGSGERHYRICVNDEVDIRVRNQPDLDDVVTVRPDGKISVPRVGSVVAEGKTIEELESELRDSLEKVVAQPEVSVSLRQFHSDIYYEGETMKRIGLKNLEGISVIVRTAERRVYVMGEVKGAGQIPYRGTMTLNQAIASAGGTMRTAKLKEVKIVRQVGLHQPPQTILVDLRSTIRGRGVQDMDLQHLDVVVVGKTPIARFTDTLEQYLFNIVPFTRNNPNFNLFYSLGGGANPAAIVSPSP